MAEVDTSATKAPAPEENLETNKKVEAAAVNVEETNKTTDESFFEFQGLTWDDVALWPDGRLTFRNKDAQFCKYKEIRKICSILEVRGVKNARKDEMIEKVKTLMDPKRAVLAKRPREEEADKSFIIKAQQDDGGTAHVSNSLSREIVAASTTTAGSAPVGRITQAAVQEILNSNNCDEREKREYAAQDEMRHIELLDRVRESIKKIRKEIKEEEDPEIIKDLKEDLEYEMKRKKTIMGEGGTWHKYEVGS
ncbi:hypothetical protein ACA910_013266 [Epithemia clementina (nom. ined.)]